MIEDLSDVVDSFLTGTYPVRRCTAATMVNGYLTDDGSTSFSMPASVQPLTPREMERLPEGLRSKEMLAVFSTRQLQTKGTFGPDVITIGDSDYEVEAVEQWSVLGGYWRALVAKRA